MKLLTLMTLLALPFAISAEDDCTRQSDVSRNVVKKKCADGTVVSVNDPCSDGSTGEILDSDVR